MASEYGDSRDFAICCLLCASLWKPSKRVFRCGYVFLAIAIIAFALAALGWNLIDRAFSESLSAINQTVGGVFFTSAVVAVMAILRWSGREKSNLVGVSVLVAIGVWSLVFLFKAFFGVPVSITRKAQLIRSPAPTLPSVPRTWDLKSPQSTEAAKTLHISMRFFMSPKSNPGPSFTVVNQSDVIAKNVRWGIALWDTRFADQASTIPILTYPIDWIKPQEQIGTVGLFGQPPAQVNTGDRLVGSAAVDCPDCVPKSYVLFVIWGEGGWYGETGKRWKGKIVLPADGVSKAGREAYFKAIAGIIPPNSRIPLSEPHR